MVTLQGSKLIHSTACHPIVDARNNNILCGSANGSIHVWNVYKTRSTAGRTNAHTIIQQQQPKRRNIHSIRSSRSDDGTAGYEERAKNDSQVLANSGISCLAMSPCSTILATAHMSGKICLRSASR